MRFMISMGIEAMRDKEDKRRKEGCTGRMEERD
ncbi:hypothetical protein IMSAGC007_02511 [Lachnospiraceae bacterium]|jgi:hypothetical protein|nr:hypothetical protein IMSAGC007_02511 [Lachnospiraceae bacterium]